MGSRVALVKTQGASGRRVRAGLCVDQRRPNLGASRIASNFIPKHLKYHWPSPPPVYDPAKAMRLLAEAGYPNGFDAGFYRCDSSYANLGEAAVNNLAAVGIKAQMRPLERAAFDRGFTDKRYKKGIIQGSSTAFGLGHERWGLRLPPVSEKLPPG